MSQFTLSILLGGYKTLLDRMYNNNRHTEGQAYEILFERGGTC